MNRKHRRAQGGKATGENRANHVAAQWSAKGHAHARQHQLKQALVCFQKAVAADKSNQTYKMNLGKIALRLGQYQMAFDVLSPLIGRGADDMVCKILLVRACAGLRIEGFRNDVKQVVLSCLKTDGLEHQNLAPIWFQNLQYDKKHAGFFKNPPENLKKYDDYISYGLRRFFTISPKMERRLTQLRQYILDAVLTERGDDVLPLAADMAQHCFLGEYSFATTSAEETALDDIVKSFQRGDYTAGGLLAYAMYAPLSSLPDIADVLERVRDKNLHNVAQQQVVECHDELARRKSIPVLGGIENNVSQDVRHMYEDNPYPRWHAVNMQAAPLTGADFDYLIAGCGTGRSTYQTAQLLPDAKITAIDLSLTSLSYAQRKTAAAGLTTVAFKQADILDVGKLNTSFDVIECSGVLHHMAEPLSGWCALLSVLSAGGCMNIGLYSRNARGVIFAAQKYAQDKGYNDSAQGIKDFRQDILSLPEDNPLFALTRRQDFYTVSGCRDLVFHVQEHCYDLQEIKDMLAQLKLKTLRLTPATPAIASLYRQTFPDDPHMCDLDNWNALEKEYPQICVGMYQFWCMRADETPQDNARIAQHFEQLIR